MISVKIMQTSAIIFFFTVLLIKILSEDSTSDTVKNALLGVLFSSAITLFASALYSVWCNE